MKTITVYDDTYQRLEKLAEDMDVIIAELIDAFMEFESEVVEANKDWISMINSSERV